MSVLWWWCSNTTRLHDTSITQIQGPVSLTFFDRNSNSMETSPCHNAVVGHQIATNFCTCYDSTAFVPCAKFCSDHCIEIEVRVKRNFHGIWIAMEKTLVKRDPVPHPGSGQGIVHKRKYWNAVFQQFIFSVDWHRFCKNWMFIFYCIVGSSET